MRAGGPERLYGGYREVLQDDTCPDAELVDLHGLVALDRQRQPVAAGVHADVHAASVATGHKVEAADIGPRPAVDVRRARA